MCGITGLVSVKGEPVGHHIGPMTAALRHRGPDDEGTLLAHGRTGQWMVFGGADTPAELDMRGLDERAHGPYNLALGHRRLAILDLSPAGHEPMPYRQGALWITYNGEVYNYIELRRELETLGHAFRTATDAEVILAAYAAWGPGCLNRFNGMFAFALWDRHARVLFCARDRLGIKPFHYTWDGQLFAFASEIKGLLAHPAIARQPNDPIVYDYLALGSQDHTDETFFAGIRRLPAAHYLRLDLEEGRLEMCRWWDAPAGPSPDVDSGLESPEQARQFRELLTESVRLRLRSDVAIGTCLSGGLDSSSIVCLANRLLLEERAVPRELAGDRQKTFSACFDDPAIDERAYIQQVIDATGAESHQVYPQGLGGLWDELGRLVWHQEEPFGSTSIYSQWSVMRLAKERGVTVLLDGQGGDELLAGYHLYAGTYLAQILRTRRAWDAVKASQALSANTGRRRAFLLALALYNSVPSPAQEVLSRAGNTRFRTNPTLAASALAPDFERRFSKQRSGGGKHQAFRDLRQRLHSDTFVHSLPALLRYEDRNSMAFSLEARVPFLDFRLVEFCNSLPTAQLIRQGWTKWILRQAMDGILPEGVRWRRSKLGFATPEQQWLREGSTRIRHLFGEGQVLSGAYLSRETVRQLRTLESGEVARIPGLWRMVNLELWLRVFQSAGTTQRDPLTGAPIPAGGLTSP